MPTITAEGGSGRGSSAPAQVGLMNCTTCDALDSSRCEGNRVLDALALEAQQGRETSARRLFRGLRPLLRTAARRVMSTSRAGSVSPQDLVQVGSLCVWRIIAAARYEARAHFAAQALIAANRAMRDFVRSHAFDVNLSDHVARGRRRSGKHPALQRDGERSGGPQVTVSKGGPIRLLRFSVASNTSEDIPCELHDPTSPTPEQLCVASERKVAVRQALERISPDQANVVRRIYGLGCEEMSLRALAASSEVNRTRLDGTLKAAQAEVRRLLRRSV